MINSPFDADYQIINESGLFDRGFYLKANPDVAEASGDPLMHFCEYGWKESRDPAPFFSTRYYTSNVTQKDELQGNPFVHFLTKGIQRSLRTRPEIVGPSESIPVIRSTQWANVRPRLEACGIDVIVPVYRGMQDTAACLFSVLTCETDVPFRLIVINDKSPEPQVHKLLRALSRRGLFYLVENQKNLGFTQSVNLGMEIAQTTHKVLLNSDTIVYNRWIDRILAHAQKHNRIGTITPLSNNATIFSYPDTNASNNYSIELPLSSLDLIASAANAGVIVDVPTGVGFCMFIHSECYREVGALDVETFNRGYGEENDFCVRAALAGWRNVSATDVFVRHTGEVSFALDAATQQKSGYIALLKKHPVYEGLVRKFVARDPLRRARQNIDLARLLVRIAKKKVVIFVSHAQGGGIDTHLGQLAEKLESLGIEALLLSANRANAAQFSINSFINRLYLPNLSALSASEFTKIVLLRLAASGPCLIHLHSFVGFDLSALSSLVKACAFAGIQIINTVHDYSAICPRNQLVDDGEDYCGIPPADECNECLRSHSFPGKQMGEPDILAYRAQCSGILSFAEQTFVPSNDTKNRLAPYFPGLKLDVRAHIEPNRMSKRARKNTNKQCASSLINVVSLGAIGPHKGSNVIWACAADALKRSLPLKFHVVGYTNIDSRLADVGVSISGPYYSKSELESKIKNIDPQMAFFSSIWPETYLYTLSDAFELGIFPVAFNIGAQAERIRSANWGALIDIAERFNPALINDAFIKVNEEFGKDETPELNFVSVDDITAYYGYAWRARRSIQRARGQ